MSAKTLARGPCVTATVDAVHFLAPCRLGSIAIIAAMVNRTFNSSMEVGWAARLLVQRLVGWLVGRLAAFGCGGDGVPWSSGRLAFHWVCVWPCG